MSDRLPTRLWVDALVRRVSVGGASAFIMQSGDSERGDVMVKVARLDGTAALFVPSPLSFEVKTFDWLPKAGEWAKEFDVDEIVTRRKSYDPDVWVVEIEDRDGRNFLTEPVNYE
ncbi:DUF1491 family protein [Ponticaulis sp.]|uniref:DUF1491 family protein n=1 Tax=Ponticaulis sp. TaxID=2020902 RepID=UPI000B6B7837|nr:DUF1491 family protein [Ponticaulis sp.]MAI90325.1 hypothetical protein [Ponticaulis sp.]OUX99963.1 MAG: hypothetical protein CBB65_07785 [Hyphomonadaceae bacterium TMED5]